MSHKDLFNKLSKPKSNQPSLKEVMNILNFFDPNKFDDNDVEVEMRKEEKLLKRQQNKQLNNNKLVDKPINKPINRDEEEDETEEKIKLEGMYLRKLEEPINQYLFCQESQNYVPVGYRYAGKHISKTKQTTYLYTKKDESELFVVHCLGKVIGQHENYQIHEPLDITSQLTKSDMSRVRDGIKLNLYS